MVVRKAKPAALAERAKGTRDRLEAMADVVSSLPGLKPAREVARFDEAVPTIFPIFDHRVQVGGFPIRRLSLVHGPSSEGKTPFVIGLLRSFLARGHFAMFVDAERSTGRKWLGELMGPTLDLPTFSMPEKIGTYEDVRASVRVYCEAIGKARDAGKIPDDVSAIIGIDSIRKLIPKALWDELAKSAKRAADGDKGDKPGRFGKKPKGHIDGMGGRAAQMKAAFNSAFVDELIPLLHDTKTSMVIIARESEEEGEGFLAESVIKVGGGRALLYDSSLWLRVVDAPVWEKLKPSDEKPTLVGHRHTIEFRRSKVGARVEKMPSAAFHTSNGLVSPVGFDRERDVLELGRDLDLVKEAGNWLSFGDTKLGNGEARALEHLRGDPTVCDALEQTCRASAGFVVA